jgi:predicted ATPase/class 3 adenylate cyclase
MSALPSGTVAFLFTDVEGSARIWEERASEMHGAQVLYDACLRRIIESHGGHVFKTLTDVFCAVFSDTHAAFQAAFEAQQELKLLPGLASELRIRTAIHVGHAEPRDNDYYGPTVNRVARILAAAQGGMILLSEPARALLGASLPSGVTLADRGVHRLKNLTDPERIFQVLHPSLAPGNLPLATLSEIRHNLPPQMDAFIGREREAREVAALMARPDVALLTLTGPGGCGKTRLALHVAENMAEQFTDGVWWTDLAGLRQPEGVLPAILAGFHLPEQSGIAPVERLSSYLRERNALLVLDNFEQVVEAATDIAAILRRCPRVRVLITSRERLNLTMEHEFPVPPLDMEDSVSLFADRAQEAQPHFYVTQSNIGEIRTICQRLEGIPLAVELAAARVRGLSLAQIHHRLDRRFELLSGARRDVPDRQRTLLHTLDWSYGLLSADEQNLFTLLAVFPGGFSLEAADAVCGSGCDSVLDTIFSLCDKSLLRASSVEGGTRYTMLQTLREYGLEKLAAQGRLTEIRSRHARYYLDYLRRTDWLRRREAVGLVTAEMDNLRAGMETAIALDDDRMVADYALNLRWYFFIHGLFREGIERMSAAVTAARRLEDPHALCIILIELGMLLYQIDGDQALLLGQESAVLALSLDDPRLRSRALELMAWGLAYQERWEEAFAALEEALERTRAAGDFYQAVNAASDLAWAYSEHRDTERAIPLLHEAIRMSRENRYERALALNLNRLGHALLNTDRAKARRCLSEALDSALTIGDDWIKAMACWHLGTLSQAEKDTAEAVRCYRESLVTFDRMGITTQPASLLAELPSLAVLSGDYERAARLYALHEAACRLENQTPAPQDDLPAAVLEAIYKQAGRETVERLRLQAVSLSWEEILRRVLDDLPASEGTGAQNGQ